MNRLCRQLSIESPGPNNLKECVFNFQIPVPDVPITGARIKTVCAGACYRRQRSPSISSISSVSSDISDITIKPSSSNLPAHQGLRDGALFPGYEVAGIIESLGSQVTSKLNPRGFTVGTRVVLYPFEDVPSGYAEYICVPSLNYLVPIPDNLSFPIAAMLPTGALLAMNAVEKAHEIITTLLNERQSNTKCHILIVGTGGLALWAVRLAQHYFIDFTLKHRVKITVASLRDEGLILAQEIENITIVQWNEDLYEKQLIERTIDACNGSVDIVIDFGTTSRSLHRSMQCLNKGGVILLSEDVGEKLLPKFSRRAEEREQKIIAVANGTVNQLDELVKLVADKKIKPPPHSVFPLDEAAEVVKKLCYSEIAGRAIFRFHDIN